MSVRRYISGSGHSRRLLHANPALPVRDDRSGVRATATPSSTLPTSHYVKLFVTLTNCPTHTRWK